MPFRRPIQQEKAEKTTTIGAYPAYLSYFRMSASSLAHERLQALHVSPTCSTIQPAPAHGKLRDEKRY